MGSAGLNSKIKLDNPLERRLAADVGVAAMSGVVRGRFDMENLAMQLITDAAAVGMQQKQPQPVTDDYRQSQNAASRGGNALSPWESELINDAQFTAQTPLPSVTLDVNDEVLAQHIGAEVSRFQHVDPPRNPSGFWQRVEQRYENIFEHRALIAEGRAAANSEVIRESLGNATANQQNDLDLGYTESVAQTRAGWIGAGELPLPPVAKGIMQASRLMNRWGVFGKQIPTERIAANEAINHINGLRLKRTLAIDQAKSIFDETGELTNEAINNSILITQGNRLGNKQLRDILSSKGNIYDWAKYSTDSTFSPSGNFQVHFYKNNVTDEIYYGMDYKSVFDHQGRWNFELNPSFDYEPPRFNL